MSTRIQVIGDEVWADGYRVATLVTDGVPATVQRAVIETLQERQVSERFRIVSYMLGLAK